jgi:GntR family transcriptional regulator / MocR family aminotransferase
MRELYASRLECLREAVRSRLEGVLDIPDVQAGIHVTASLARGVQAECVAVASAALNVETIPIRRFVLATPRPEALLLGFASYDARQIRDGVDSLARAIEQCSRSSHRSPRSSTNA